MILFSCGCGFRSGKQDAAIKHIEETGHVISVGGVITPMELGYVKAARDESTRS